MHVVVIGAGPAGLTAAYRLMQGGAAVEVCEASGRVGGMAGSFSLWGQTVDFGPHRFFSADPRINEVWKSVVGKEYRVVRRLTRIYYNRRFFYYPLRPLNALFRMGFIGAFLCGASYLWAKVRPLPEEECETFEGWVSQRFGRRLYRQFFKTYSEKLWGIPCRELDADFAAQRIKKFSLGEAFKAMFTGARASGHATLVDQFMYPLKGTGAVYETMAAKIEQGGGRIRLNSPVRRILARDGRACGVELEGGTRLEADAVVSSMPLTLAAQGFEDVPAGVREACSRLRYRDTILVYLRIAGRDLFPDNWLYVHSADLRTGRITNFRNWVPELYGQSPDTIVAMEYWCYDDDEIWKAPDAELVALATRELQATGLNLGAKIESGHVERLHRSYPVYARGYHDTLDRVVRYLKRFQGISFIGRYGAFKYNNQDHSILMGILAAENILGGAGHDLWAVNTGDDYQEAAAAPDSGRR